MFYDAGRPGCLTASFGTQRKEEEEEKEHPIEPGVDVALDETRAPTSYLVSSSESSDVGVRPVDSSATTLFPNKKETIMKGLLKVGTAAPHWSLKTQTGATLTLKSLLGRGKSVVFYSYPKDDTPGCTKEACNFTSDYAELSKKATVVGISQDDVASHEAFHSKFSLAFDLVADPEGGVLSTYGMANGARVTYIIDDLGMISHVRRRHPMDGIPRLVPAHIGQWVRAAVI